MKVPEAYASTGGIVYRMKKYGISENRRRTCKAVLPALLLVLLMLAGCGKSDVASLEDEETSESLQLPEQDVIESAAQSGWEKIQEWYAAGMAGEGTYEYHDAAGNLFQSNLDPLAYVNDYKRSGFSKIGDGVGDVTASYKDDKYTCVQGIDVSSHCGDIDWEKVAQDGIRFTFIQIGYRGYTEGGLNIDQYFEKNMEGAIENGLDVGVYFFSQAVNQQEAVQEAEFVLKALRDYAAAHDISTDKLLQLPIVYDPETIGKDNARTNDVSGSQFTSNCRAFCDRIAREGYKPAVYCNAYWQAYVLKMSELNEYSIWYADFWSYPQSPYHFEFWQYTYTGKVDGLGEGVTVDKDIWIIPK